jgi:hypothetical protein
VEAPAIHQNRAVFAAHLATSLPFLATIVPLLPPITPNVKSPWVANRLEFDVCEESHADQRSKSGKNGNVHQSSQHCHVG